MTTLEINADEEETILDLPEGDVELTTMHPVVFWCARRDPSVRKGDYRTELQRLHAGVPVQIANVPPGWKLAISLRPDLPAIHTKRPAPPPPPAPPSLTAEELEELRLAKQIAKDMERAEIVNEAYDLVMARLAPPAPVDEPPPLSPHPDELMSNYGPVGEDAITGDMLLDAFEADAVETAAVVKTLSATRLKHLSEQLNVTRAALDREHSATGIANPRSAAIDRLLNLLIRRGEV